MISSHMEYKNLGYAFDELNLFSVSHLYSYLHLICFRACRCRGGEVRILI